MKVSVIIVSYNVRYFLEVCLDSVARAAAGLAVEVIVVDNQSADDSVAMVRERFPQVTLIANGDNRGFSRANNQAVGIAGGDYVLFLNPDTVMPEDFLRKTVAYMDAHPEAGALGPRLIDGKGRFAPDGKKGFPNLRVALFKAAGLHKFFPKSPYFNAYYAAGVGERETAAVEVLSGCCMLVRRAILAPIGGAFDEDFFMYCEDVDLSWRVRMTGGKCVYFPEVDLIHYKGESTRKATLTYIRVFNEALATFVRKHYSKGGARLFLAVINVGIVLRAVLGAVRGLFRVLKMPIFDALVLLTTLWLMKDFWVMQVKNMKPVPPSALWATFPVYLALWIGSMFLMGAYDKNYRALRVLRGMGIGTVLTLAYYGLLGPELRYSRVIIVLSGLIGTVALLGLHELLYRLGIFKYVPYDALPRKAVIVANPGAYEQTAATLERVHYAPALSGRIAPVIEAPGALAALPQMKETLYTLGVEEVIFCINGLGYETVLQQMQHCGPAYDYKIHLPGSQSFVGSNSSHTSGDLYTADRRYNLAEPAQQRNKRTLDIVASLGLLVLLPVLFFGVKNAGRFAGNILGVLTGKLSWVGYGAGEQAQLPGLRRGVLPPYFLQAGFEPPAAVRRQLAEDYAQHYVAGTDVALLLRNWRWLGRQPD